MNIKDSTTFSMVNSRINSNIVCNTYGQLADWQISQNGASRTMQDVTAEDDGHFLKCPNAYTRCKDLHEELTHIQK